MQKINGNNLYMLVVDWMALPMKYVLLCYEMDVVYFLVDKV